MLQVIRSLSRSCKRKTKVGFAKSCVVFYLPNTVSDRYAFFFILKAVTTQYDESDLTVLIAKVVQLMLMLIYPSNF